MLLSQLIRELQSCMSEQGDVEVMVNDGSNMVPLVDESVTFDVEGPWVQIDLTA